MDAVFNILSIPFAIAAMIGAPFLWVKLVNKLEKIFEPLLGSHAQIAAALSPVFLFALLAYVGMHTLTRYQFQMACIAFVLLTSLAGFWAVIKRRH